MLLCCSPTLRLSPSSTCTTRTPPHRLTHSLTHSLRWCPTPRVILTASPNILTLFYRSDLIPSHTTVQPSPIIHHPSSPPSHHSLTHSTPLHSTTRPNTNTHTHIRDSQLPFPLPLPRKRGQLSQPGIPMSAHGNITWNLQKFLLTDHTSIILE
ncbi:hypothetical protein CSPX01_04668 [Colletotrichum filicis]|nr:hypothetical protein CSPX01_04668 [Colletotrichum filicis]